jgi:predicted regulator of Ras-like GTPase activity (Roadblock/LC7/MglB family)
MSFDTELRSVLTSVKGAEAVALMGFDGIIVAESRSEGAQVPYQEVGVEFSRVIKEASKVSVGNGIGDLAEMTIDSGQHRFVFRVLNQEYFVLLMLSPDANVGKGRYYLRRALPALQKEL